MSDKYDIYDKDGRKVATAERQLSPYEQGERAGQQITIWFVILMICGGFIIFIPYWIIMKLAQWTKRAPQIMIPLYVLALCFLVFMAFRFSAAVATMRQNVTADITAHTRAIEYHHNNTIAVRGFTVRYEIVRKTDTGRSKMQVELPVVFGDCLTTVFNAPTITVLFRGEFDVNSSSKPIRDEIFLTNTDDNHRIDEYYCPEKDCKEQTARTCKTYAIGTPLYKTNFLGTWVSVST